MDQQMGIRRIDTDTVTVMRDSHGVIIQAAGQALKLSYEEWSELCRVVGAVTDAWSYNGQ